MKALKDRLNKIKQFINEQNMHDQDKADYLRNLFIDYIYSYEDDIDTKDDKNDYEPRLRNKRDKFRNMDHIKEKETILRCNQSLFSEAELLKMLSDIKVVEKLREEYKNGKSKDEINKKIEELKKPKPKNDNKQLNEGRNK